jgi:hypothetical protein
MLMGWQRGLRASIEGFITSCGLMLSSLSPDFRVEYLLLIQEQVTQHEQAPGSACYLCIAGPVAITIASCHANKLGLPGIDSPNR